MATLGADLNVEVSLTNDTKIYIALIILASAIAFKKIKGIPGKLSAYGLAGHHGGLMNALNGQNKDPKKASKRASLEERLKKYTCGKNHKKYYEKNKQKNIILSQTIKSMWRFFDSIKQSEIN